jgi:hypothetical protein
MLNARERILLADLMAFHQDPFRTFDEFARFQRLFQAADLVVQHCLLQFPGGDIGDEGKHLDIVFGVCAVCARLYIDRADDLVARNQRRGEERLKLGFLGFGQILEMRVVRRVTGGNRLADFRSVTRQALAQFQARMSDRVRRQSRARFEHEIILVVEQVDGTRVGVDYARGLARDQREDLIERPSRANRARDFAQCGELPLQFLCQHIGGCHGSELYERVADSSNGRNRVWRVADPKIITSHLPSAIRRLLFANLS